MGLGYRMRVFRWREGGKEGREGREEGEGGREEKLKGKRRRVENGCGEWGKKECERWRKK